MNKFELTPEILHQAEQCKTVEEILEKAKEFDKDITQEQAQRIFDMLHAQNGEVSDEELDNVSGGSGCLEEPACPKCNTNAHVKMRSMYKRRTSPGSRYICIKCGTEF